MTDTPPPPANGDAPANGPPPGDAPEREPAYGDLPGDVPPPGDAPGSGPVSGSSAGGDLALVVGAGLFGLTGALELRRRGYSVTVLDPGPVPHPYAASNDHSRMVRMDYGTDALYSRLGAEAIAGWQQWNARWGRPLYRQDGFLVLSSRPIDAAPEGDSLRTLTAEGWPVERLDSPTIRLNYPQWNFDRYTDGYFNPNGGWVEAAEVIRLLAQEAAEAGVILRTGFTAEQLITRDGRAVGVRSTELEEIYGDEIVLAAGVWTPRLWPPLQEVMRPVAQPIMYFMPADPELYRPPEFPPWAADIPRTGWYGFPVNRDGLVKVANHGPGRPVGPDAARDITPDAVTQCREFLEGSLPGLAGAPLQSGKLCFYCDTWDGDFWIGRDPDCAGLTVATGGSGHAFKFAPALGRLVADAVDGHPNPYKARFSWRPRGSTAAEATRYTGQ